MNLDEAKDAIREIDKAKRIVVSCHQNPEGDAIGSALAMLLALEAAGKEAVAVNQDNVPDNVKFLPAIDRLVREIPEDFDFDLAIIVDCGELSRIGKETEKRITDSGHKIINIDHHATNTFFGDINIVITNASAAAEITFEFLKLMDVAITKEIATNLYTGLIADTGSFKYTNTTPAVLASAGELIGAGADPAFICAQYFDIRPLNNMKLLAMVLDTIEVSLKGKFASVEVTGQMFDATSTSQDAVESFVEYPRNVEGVLVAALLRERPEGGVKISLRSNPGKNMVDVSKIAQSLGGGGHVVAAGCSIDTDLVQAKKIIQDKVSKAIEGLQI